MRKNRAYASAVADAPEPITDEAVEKIAKKPTKSRKPPTGEYGRIHPTRAEAELYAVEPSENAENNPFGIWQWKGKVVWAKNKQEAVYLISVPQHKVEEKDEAGNVVKYKYDAIDEEADPVRLDAERKGRVRKLAATEVSFLLQLLELNDAEKFAKVAALVPHMVPYFPVEFGGLAKEIPDELKNNELSTMFLS